MRREFPAKVKVAAFERAGGCCEMCGVKIRPGNGPEYDHGVPAALGGSGELDNCIVACRTCHGLKTTTRDVPMIAKGKRVRAKHICAKDKRNGFRGWRTFSGEIRYARDRS